MERSPFEAVAAQVRAWLDSGAGSAWARRADRLRVGEGHAWDVDLQDDALAVRNVRVVLPVDFPASPCELWVEPRHFLKLPHVEADGHVCLGLAAIPDDYDDPVGAVARALAALNDQLLGPAASGQWIEEQFHSERASYWAQYCGTRRQMPDRRPVAARTFVDIGETGQWSEGAIAAYIPTRSKHRRYALQLATVASVDPHEIAARHGWADGTMVRGRALFVRLGDDVPWTPSTWAASFSDLDALVNRATDRECSLADWVSHVSSLHEPAQPKRAGKARRKREPDIPPGAPPQLVVLVQGGVMFAYQLFTSAIPLLQPPGIEPVRVSRVDPDWALARDHSLEVLHARRKKRVLLVGNGSLGSPLAKALARSGIGHLDILDAELMDVENTSRHELGMADVGQPKASALARGLGRDVPGLNVQGFRAEATAWMTQHCTPGKYDLVVECTAESSVRTFISHMRSTLLGDAPVIHAWTEPLCSAGHVVLTQTAVRWPADDPADALVNASDLSARDTRINLPACSDGFHPYGAADIQLVAAFAAERVIGVLDDMQQPSAVWSWVRSSAYFKALPVPVNIRAIVPVSSGIADSAATTRKLSNVLGRE
ncbi:MULTISPECIES: ThiF family adenylyltransferase [Burkholderia cepacia complex]|uniref:ThiF family adenylyltransferase n=1 Tax=Burkholderia cepacia complex TaxID=87882 RepID=UPI001CF40217|nr:MULTISPECIES: ThiF family adenylyltransferase [Burkholderia cepacia complex]MCA8057139.1 ThiF family adenylyltransferase [Burkholderia cepacia]MDN7534671.1 ThiF family adenylyltransferase [Burkholderia orbicola]